MKGSTERHGEIALARRMLTIVWKNFGRYRFAVDPGTPNGQAVRYAAVRGWAKRHADDRYALTDAGVREALARGAGAD